MTFNHYGAAWTIIQGCCEAAVLANLLGDRVIAQLAGAAALGAAEKLGIPEREVYRLQQIMACEIMGVQLHPHAFTKLERRLRRGAANDNVADTPHAPRRADRIFVDERN